MTSTIKYLPFFQLVFVVIGGLIEYWAFGSVGPLLQVLVFIAVTFAVFLRVGSKSQEWPQRKDTMQAAKKSGIAMAAIACIGYGFGCVFMPQHFVQELQHLLWIMPLLFAAVWLGVTIVCLCVGDTVATIYNVYPRRNKTIGFRHYPGD